jgi:hypothetical protein
MTASFSSAWSGETPTTGARGPDPRQDGGGVVADEGQVADGHAAIVGDVESELDLRGVPAAARDAAIRPSESDRTAAWAHMSQADEGLLGNWNPCLVCQEKPQ